MKPESNIKAAVGCFLSNFKKLRYLPFVTDAEVEILFGPQVARMLARLDKYNCLRQICLRCSSRCCQRVKCELYDGRFSGCLVKHWRPVLCRMHFCEVYTSVYKLEVKILGDIYLESLIAAAGIDAVTAGWFDCPAFAPLIPGFISEINPLLGELRNGKIPAPEVIQYIYDLIEKGPK